MTSTYQSINLDIKDTKRKPITVAEYAQLSEKETHHYKADYKQYRPKKVRAYDECCECGNRRFVGWETIQIPIGEPYRYIPNDLLTAHVLDNLLSSNALTSRVLGKAFYGDVQ